MLRTALRLIILVLALHGAPAAARGLVLVVSGGEHAAHATVVEALRTNLALQPQTAPEIKVVDIAGFRTWSDSPGNGAVKLIVTVGTQAARAAREASPRVPILYTVIPRQAGVDLARTDVRDSAIYLDQPFRLQLDLIRLALPKRDRLGVVLGPTSAALRDELRAAAKAKGFRLDIEQIDSSQALLPALNKVLEDNDVLLSVADPVVFNNHTIHHLLLSTYRHDVPVLGLSRAYVEAGALLAVYTTPEQIGTHITDVLLKLASTGQWTLPAPQPPRYFSVTVNRRVASALNLVLPDDAELLRKLLAVSASP